MTSLSSTEHVLEITAEEAEKSGLTHGPAAWATADDLRRDAEGLLEDLIVGQGFSKLYHTTSEGRVHTELPYALLNHICDKMGWELSYGIKPAPDKASAATS